MKLDKIKDKENIWKASRENKHITYMGILKSFSADFSAEALQARREWHDILNVMKGQNIQPRLLYPARLSFWFEGESKSFTDKQQLRAFSTTNPDLQQILKELPEAKKRPQLETKTLQMTRITSKGIDTVNVGNHPLFNMLPNPEIGRRGGYKCRTLEMHFQLRDQQLKTIR